jgi:exosortase D (VPLPA-CTERM-specific)
MASDAQAADADQQKLWCSTAALWAVVGIGLAFAVFSAYDGVVEMIHRWNTSEEYGYGYLIPVITAFLIWQRKDELGSLPFTGSWYGVGLLLAGVAVTLAGQLSTLHSVTQYGFVLALMGAAWALMGGTPFRVVLLPMLLLFLMVPLPAFVFNNLSAQLQLLSSEIGVAVIRLFGISVHLEGNVIDLGAYQLQVVEACSGLRYLFPLVSLSIIAAFFYREKTWKRVVLILSSIPITVFMNSFRIGVIGVLVEHGGPEQAEGFLHDFEGWVVFMSCVGLLIAEMWLMSCAGPGRRPLAEVFGIDLPAGRGQGECRQRPVVVQVWVALVLLGIGAAAANMVSEREEIVPPRKLFALFPDTVDGWVGRSDRLERIYLDALKLDDYVLMDFRRPKGGSVNFYAAYYASQRSGASAHSPRSCLPGGGWRMLSLEPFEVSPGLTVNRALIQKGEYRQLVYYWFKQRERILINEFMVKAFLLWDALSKNRTDGALIRLTTLLAPAEDVSRADARLTEFASAIAPKLSEYVPD